VFKPGNNAWYQVVLKQGRNRQIRRMFEGVGCYVLKLRRMSIGPIDLSSLAPGQWRHLTEREVHRLKRAAGHPGAKRA
jgi:pseudouridine synthase